MARTDIDLGKIKNLLLKKIFVMPSERLSAGLDVGTDSVKIALVKHNPKNKKLLAIGFAKIERRKKPPSKQKEGEETPEQQEKRREPSRSDVIKAITEAVASCKHGIKPPVTCSINDPSVNIRTINMVEMPVEELPGSIKWEAEQYIPYPIDEAALAFRAAGTVQEGDVKRLRTLIVTAQKKVLDEHLSRVRESRLRSGAVTAEPIGFEALMRFSAGEMKQTIAVVSIGAKATGITILKDGSISFTREIPGGGEDMTAAIQRNLDIGHEEAEKLKQSEFADESSKIFPGISPILEKLSQETMRTIDFFKTQIDQQGVQKILLCGGASSMKNIDKYIADVTGLSTEVLDPFKGFELEKRLQGDERLARLAPSFAAAVGLALAAKSGDLMDLAAKEAMKEGVEFIKESYPWLVAVGAVAIIGIIHIALGMQLGKYQDKKTRCDELITEYEPKLAQARKYTKSKQLSIARIDWLGKATARNHEWTGVLQGIAKARPGKKLWFAGVDYDPEKRQLNITGSAADPKLVSDYHLSLKALPLFGGVELLHMKTISRDGRRVVDFAITCQLKED